MDSPKKDEKTLNEVATLNKRKFRIRLAISTHVDKLIAIRTPRPEFHTLSVVWLFLLVPSSEHQREFPLSDVQMNDRKRSIVFEASFLLSTHKYFQEFPAQENAQFFPFQNSQQNNKNFYEKLRTFIKRTIEEIQNRQIERSCQRSSFVVTPAYVGKEQCY